MECFLNVMIANSQVVNFGVSSDPGETMLKYSHNLQLKTKRKAEKIRMPRLRILKNIFLLSFRIPLIFKWFLLMLHLKNLVRVQRFISYNL
ncbi:hypothetical protein D1164_20795 [Mariniphaga sediminis]|uniref:Uncharacterized protein n=1 Tax=Mariniphaga sediminis TaxID=1628158 RepID=A0A399CVM5_9BACT|nr:hypothetical protein D1164_20795 [Mariniphaga sediminis]